LVIGVSSSRLLPARLRRVAEVAAGVGPMVSCALLILLS
jgi:hypothetical protein